MSRQTIGLLNRKMITIMICKEAPGKDWKALVLITISSGDFSAPADIPAIKEPSGLNRQDGKLLSDGFTTSMARRTVSFCTNFTVPEDLVRIMHTHSCHYSIHQVWSGS